MADDNNEAGSTGKLAPKPPSRRGHPSDMYGISRKSPDATGQQAWTVRLSRGGRMIQTSFSDSTYGGPAQSLFVARAYRDAVLEIVPPLTRTEMRQVTRKKAPSEHRSEITGVHYAKATRNRSAAWIARIELPAEDIPGRPRKGTKRPRRSITRRFSITEPLAQPGKTISGGSTKRNFEALIPRGKREWVLSCTYLENSDADDLRSLAGGVVRQWWNGVSYLGNVHLNVR